VWSGIDAKRLGLVDQLGDSADAVQLAAELAGLGDDFDVEHFDVEVGFGEALGLRVQASIARVLAPLVPQAMWPTLLPRSLQPVVAELDRVSRLSDPRNTYMYCLACSPD
jgi:protease IV